jgi:hypothetical protein
LLLELWRVLRRHVDHPFLSPDTISGNRYVNESGANSISPYGYAGFPSLEEWRRAVRALLDEARALEAKGLSGYVYTQLSDVEEETNGLLSFDRRVNKLLS